MLAEALDKLTELVKAGQTPTVVTLDGDRRIARVWIPQKEHLLDVKLGIPPRGHGVLTVESFTQAVKRYAEVASNAAVWVTTGQIVLVTDDDDYRHNRVTLPVVKSPLFNTLQKAAIVDQKETLKWLRHDLKAATIMPDNFVLTIASLRWETNDTEEGKVGTTKSTMGRQITAEVKGEVPIPEEIEVGFDPFPEIDDLASTVRVRCSVFTDAEKRTIEIAPQPGQIGLATADALEQLATFIASKIEVAVFCGTP